MPEWTIYYEKGVALNAKKDYILNRLIKWAKKYTIYLVTYKSALYLVYYTIIIPYPLLY